MTDKQIINGVNVNECDNHYIENNKHKCKYNFEECNPKKEQCTLYVTSIEEQLKAKEQECEKLKKDEKSLLNVIDHLQKTKNEWEEKYNDLGQDFDQLKAENDLYKNAHKTEQDRRRSYENALAEIKEIIEPYKMTIKKICGNCKKYDDCHACCYKDINCYKYTSSETSACEEFTYLDEFIPNLLANNILQKISECEVENEN